MTLATTLLAAALVVPNMPPPDYDDCEVVTNCVFDASRCDAKVFSVKQSPPMFIFDSAWNAAKIVLRGQSDPNLRVVCSVDNIPLVIRLR